MTKKVLRLGFKKLRRFLGLWHAQMNKSCCSRYIMFLEQGGFKIWLMKYKACESLYYFKNELMFLNIFKETNITSKIVG